MSKDLYLQHYGVLGMHWGIRRYQNKDGTLTNQGKKRYSAKDKIVNSISSNTKAAKKSIEKSVQAHKTNFKNHPIDETATLAYAGLMATSAAMLATTFATKRLNRIANKDMLIASGKTLYRTVTKNKKFNMADMKLHDIAYATPYKRDSAKYQRYFAVRNVMRGGLGKNKVRTNKFTLNQDVKVAGIKSQRKIFNDLVKNDEQFRKSMRSYGLYRPNSRLNQRVAFNSFNRSVPSMRNILTGEPVSYLNTYTNALKEKGYRAFVDHNDAKGKGIGTKYPIILIEQGENLVKQMFG